MNLENIISKCVPKFNNKFQQLFYGVMALSLTACGNNNLPNTSTLPSGFCQSETYNREGECIPTRPLDCGEGTYESNGKCLPNVVVEETANLQLLSFVALYDIVNENNGYDIFTVDGEWNNIQQLTNPPIPDRMIQYSTYSQLSSWNHSWSKDGRSIVFESNRDGSTGYSINDGELEIYTMRADGSHQQRLTNNNVWDHGAKYSPDGTKIVFMSSEEEVQFIPETFTTSDGYVEFLNGQTYPDYSKNLYVMDSDGRNRRKLTGEIDPSEYDWSPNNREIIFNQSSDYSRPHNISIVSLDLEESIRTVGEGFSAKWSHDGNMIAYVNDENQLCLVDKYGNNQRELTTGNRPQWFPDDSKLLFVRDRYEDNGAWPDIQLTTVHVINNDGTNLQTIYDYTDDIYRYDRATSSNPVDLSLSSDSKYLLFGGAEDRSSVYVMDLNTLITTQIKVDQLFLIELQWQPKP